MTDSARRNVYMVLGVNSLSYARLCLSSLLNHAIEPLQLRLITDNAHDASQLAEAVKQLDPPDRHQWSTHGFEELNDLAASKIPNHQHVRAFMHGHPCWRKITDPLLMANDDEETIILDPDVYFPSPFTFEPTPQHGLLLMWQPPNCLLPPETVERAFQLGPLADHTDIGVAHARAPIDWGWLDNYIHNLGGTQLPCSMHVESIIWAAIAMRIGGGYLDPARWWCYRSAQWKRIALKLRVRGTTILRHEPLSSVKAFHAGGHAKHWLVQANPAEPTRPDPALTRPSPIRPFDPFPQAKHQAKLRRSARLKALGYYRFLSSG
ncbi:MAG: hypothetical protein RLN76_12485 [Phycisphaeraceae bacterium]